MMKQRCTAGARTALETNGSKLKYIVLYKHSTVDTLSQSLSDGADGSLETDVIPHLPSSER
jgi:hypothetical protein